MHTVESPTPQNPDALESMTDATFDASYELDTTPTVSFPTNALIRKLKETSTIMLVDDDPDSMRTMQKQLEAAGYQNFATGDDPRPAMQIISEEKPDVIILDLMTPRLDGLEILRRLQIDGEQSQIPVIGLTASIAEQSNLDALELGAVDFLLKPVNPTELILRVRNALLVKAHQDHLQFFVQELDRQVRFQTKELIASRQEMIQCLIRAAEFRDNESGKHATRVGRYAGIVARKMELPEEFIELVECAAPLHDIGNVGIPDEILLKPGKLTIDEFEMMQKHCIYGKCVFEPMSQDEWQSLQVQSLLGGMSMSSKSTSIISMAAKVAMTHHEKWDGSGYPMGLSGDSIPMAGRITAVADVFDALSNKRPYKPAYPIEQCFDILKEGRGTHFDPRVLDAFLACRDEIEQVRQELDDNV
jgi:putative two-component system response regulator